MDTIPDSTFSTHPWQATMITVLKNLKREIQAANTTSAQSQQPLPKKFTTEALFMICVILLFVILNVIGSLATVFENCEIFGKGKHSPTVRGKAKAKDGVKCDDREMKKVSLAILHKFISCFCIKSNVRRILKTASTESELSCIHGLRAIAAIWAVVGHGSACYAAVERASDTFLDILKWRLTQIFHNGFFLLDIFLVLGGFLNAYLFSEHYEKRKGKISWLAFYLHRIARITPLYFLVLGFYSTLFPYLGSGPVWPTYDTNPVCKETWMWHALYINNFYPGVKQCLLSTWYVACEMQLYIISPIFLIMLMRRPKIGYFLIALGVSESCFINFAFTMKYNLIDGVTRFPYYFPDNLDTLHARFWQYYDILYSKPFARIGSFLIGIALGYYMYRRKISGIKRSNMVTLSLGWIIAAIFWWISLFALYGREEAIFETAVYNAMKHLLFSCSVSWVIFVCVTGQGGFVNRFLSNKVFLVMSRLSYSVYLINFVTFEGYFLSFTELAEFSYSSVLLLSLWLVLVIYAASVLMSVVFEAPLIRIISLLTSETKREIKLGKQE